MRSTDLPGRLWCNGELTDLPDKSSGECRPWCDGELNVLPGRPWCGGELSDLPGKSSGECRLTR